MVKTSLKNTVNYEKNLENVKKIWQTPGCNDLKRENL